MLPRRVTLTLITCLLIFTAANSQKSDNNKKQSVFDWFYAKETALKAEIKTDIETLSSQKMTNDELPGLFTITNTSGEKISLPVKIRARGRFRRRLCDFPPLKLDFDKDGLKAQGFKKYDEYKLVTHCFKNGIGKVYILKEFLAYRLYQQLTDNGFRVQLLKIKYRNKKGRKKAKSYGFIIENEKELAKRLDSELIEDHYNVPRDSLLLSEIHRHDVFQYMISNTDWNLPMVRNMKLLWHEEKQGYFVVPYDFDFSGLVQAYYAIPNADIGQKDIRERHFLGIARSMDELEETLSWFKSQQNAMYSYVKKFKPLGGEDRRNMINYMKTFFESVEDGRFQKVLEEANNQR